MGDEPFIEVHIHYWDHSVDGLQWAWLNSGYTFRRREGSDELDAPRYTTPELLVEADGTGLVGAVHVHAADPVEDRATETACLEAVAEETGMPNGIVGGCVLGRPDPRSCYGVTPRNPIARCPGLGVRHPSRCRRDRRSDGSRGRTRTLRRAAPIPRRVRVVRDDRRQVAAGDDRAQPRLSPARTDAGGADGVVGGDEAARPPAQRGVQDLRRRRCIGSGMDAGEHPVVGRDMR
jgi:hypothetical protein